MAGYRFAEHDPVGVLGELLIITLNSTVDSLVLAGNLPYPAPS